MQPWLLQVASCSINNLIASSFSSKFPPPLNFFSNFLDKKHKNKIVFARNSLKISAAEIQGIQIQGIPSRNNEFSILFSIIGG